MKKMRRKLFFPLFILIIFVFAGLGLLIGQLFKSHYVNSFNERFQKEGAILAYEIEQGGGISALNNKEIQEIQKLLNVKVTILDSNGDIVLDIGDDTEPFIDHEEAISEINTFALNSESGIHAFGSGNNVSYYWDTIKVDGKKDGIVVLGTTFNEFNSAYRHIWLLILFSIGLAFLVITYIGSRIVTRFTKPVESATKTAIELAKGNYRARTYEDEYNEFSLLSSSINILARNLQKITKEQEMQTDRLQTIIENMGTGLILIDDKGFITLTNRTFNGIFQVDEHALVGKSYAEVFDYKEIIHVIEEIFMTEQKRRKQIIVPMGIQMRSFEVYGAPIISYHNEWKGIVVVFHDITELKNLEQIRKDFVANVSHELKTPVTSIKGFAETLLDGAANDKQALESFLTIIYKESERLQSIISDLLELSKIEQNGYTLQIGKVDLNDVVFHIIEVLKNKAEAKSIEIEHANISGKYIVEGDANRIKQIFMNLISNALAYTPENGKIKIKFNETDSKIKVSVIDTGIGIAKEEIPRIFERFYRIDKDRSRNSGGTGLGLAIVKHLVEAHHGEIKVNSEVGKGSAFTVIFNKSYKAENTKFTNR